MRPARPLARVPVKAPLIARVKAELSDSCGQSMGTGATVGANASIVRRSVRRRSATDLGVISNPDEPDMSAGPISNTGHHLINQPVYRTLR